MEEKSLMPTTSPPIFIKYCKNGARKKDIVTKVPLFSISNVHSEGLLQN
jgi:hypothetical protein